MKFVLFFLLIPTLSFAQAKNDTKINVSTKDTGLYNKVCLLLYERGYTLKQKDKELGFIATDDKSVNGTAIRLKFIVKDTSVTVTGDLYNDIAAALARGRFAANVSKDESYYMPIRFAGMKGSGVKDAWLEMEKVAKLIGTPTYSK